MSKELWEVYVSGRVQGVGYRYFTTRLASSGFELCGYSRNQPDGKVKLEIEGEVDELEKFVERLPEGPGRVNDIKIDKKPFSGKLPAFSIAY